MVKVLIERRFVKGNDQAIKSILMKIRSEALSRPGYISGQTLFSFDDPQKMLVISSWESLEKWLAWKNSEVRIKGEEMLTIYQEDPTRYEVFVLSNPIKET